MNLARTRDYQGFGYHRDTGVGVESVLLAKLLMRRFLEMSRPILLSPRLETLKRLESVFAESCAEGWDSEEAAATALTAYQQAQKFVKLLPSMLEMPEVTSLPNGQISFEWYVRKNHLLVVATAESNSLTYAFLHGTPKAVSDI